MRKVWVVDGILRERIYLGGFEIWRRYHDVSGSWVLQDERETVHISDDHRRICMIETLTVEGGSAPGTITPRRRFQLDNHLGTACVETDETGAVISYEEYHPYGTSAFRSWASSAEVSAKRYRYTGKERDEETSLYYHGARYYAPWLGRWMSADPAGTVDGSNLFAYVRGSPVVLSDPSGTQTVYLEEDAISGRPPGHGTASSPHAPGSGDLGQVPALPEGTPDSTVGISSLGSGGGPTKAPSSGGGGGPQSAGAGGGGQGTDPAYEEYQRQTSGPISAERQGVANVGIGSTVSAGALALLLAPETGGASVLLLLLGAGGLAGGVATTGVGVTQIAGGATGNTSPEVAANANEALATADVLLNPFGAPAYTGTLVATGDEQAALAVGFGASFVGDIAYGLLGSGSRKSKPTSVSGPGDVGAMRRLEYEASPKHPVGRRPSKRVAAGPSHGQEALDVSVSIGPNTERRVGIDYQTKEFVVFDETYPGRTGKGGPPRVFHGHVRTWDELNDKMKRALIKAGMANRKGKIR